MRTTITIDDSDYAAALAVADPGMAPADLVREAIRTFTRVRSAQRLAALGGAAPGMVAVPRATAWEVREPEPPSHGARRPDDAPAPSVPPPFAP